MIDVASRRRRRLGHGRPHAYRTRLRRSTHGSSSIAGPLPVADIAFRPRLAIRKLDRVRKSINLRRQRHTPVPVPAGSVLGQRRRARAILRHPQNRCSFICTHGQPVPKPDPRDIRVQWKSFTTASRLHSALGYLSPERLPTEARKTRRQDQSSGIVNVSVKRGVNPTRGQ